MAKDQDMLEAVTNKLGENFSSRAYKYKGEESPAVALIAVSIHIKRTKITFSFQTQIRG